MKESTRKQEVTGLQLRTIERMLTLAEGGSSVNLDAGSTSYSSMVDPLG